MSRHITRMRAEDAAHLSAADRAELAAAYPAHERDARLEGLPQLGSGRVFPLAEAAVAVEAFPVPRHWPCLGALDFGWDHPTAAVRLAWDRDGDAVHVTQAYRVAQATPVVHAAALRAWGPDLPWAWPADGLQHDKGSGEQLAAQYRRQGLKMLADPAAFPDGSRGVEAGVSDMLDRMLTRRLRVFAHLADWYEEFRLYHRKDGRIVALRDDLLSATRYGLMCLRHARVEREVLPPDRPPRPFDPFAW